VAIHLSIYKQKMNFAGYVLCGSSGEDAFRIEGN